MTSFHRTTDLKQLLSSFLRDESGQDLIEYALVAAIIALGATAAMTSLAGSINTAFSKIGSSLTSAV
jgi:pilus assembly protein Flp/PilA